MDDRLDIFEEYLVVEVSLIKVCGYQRTLVVVGNRASSNLAMCVDILLEFVEFLLRPGDVWIHEVGGDNRPGNSLGEADPIRRQRKDLVMIHTRQDVHLTGHVLDLL